MAETSIMLGDDYWFSRTTTPYRWPSQTRALSAENHAHADTNGSNNAYCSRVAKIIIPARAEVLAEGKGDQQQTQVTI